MALVTTSAVVGTISGTVGGTTFVQSRHGTVIRANPLKVRPDTPRQLEHAALIKRVNSEWTSLATQEKAKWAGQATTTNRRNALGVRHPMTGIELYRLQNIPYNAMDSSLFFTSPRIHNVGDAEPVVCSFSDGGPYDVDPSIAGPPANVNQTVFGARSFRTTPPSTFPGRKRVFSGTRSGGVIDYFDEWLEVLGEMEIGEYFQVQYRAFIGGAGLTRITTVVGVVSA